MFSTLSKRNIIILATFNSNFFSFGRELILKVPITITVAFVDSVDQDQGAENLQPDLGSTLSAWVKAQLLLSYF